MCLRKEMNSLVKIFFKFPKQFSYGKNLNVLMLSGNILFRIFAVTVVSMMGYNLCSCALLVRVWCHSSLIKKIKNVLLIFFMLLYNLRRRGVLCFSKV